MKYYLLREDIQFPARWYLGDINRPRIRQPFAARRDRQQSTQAV